MSVSDLRRQKVLCAVLVLFAALLMMNAAFAAGWTSAETQSALAELSTASSTKMEVILDENLGTISWLTGSFESSSPGEPVESTYQFLEMHRQAFQIKNPREELSLLSTSCDDKLKSRHLTFEQKIKGVPVWSYRLGFHYDAQGRLYAVNGKYSPTRDLPVAPVLSGKEAMDVAKEALLFTPKEIPKPGKELSLDGDLASPSIPTFGPATAELVFFPDDLGGLRLAYFVRIDVRAPPGDWFVFVDARNGDILQRFNNIQPAGPARGSGIDLFQKTVPLNNYRDTDGKFKLINAKKPMYTNHQSDHPYTTWEGTIEVRDARHKLDPNGEPIVSPRNRVVVDPNGDNVFDDSGNLNEKTNFRSAVSLAFNLSKTYDALQKHLGVNSIDGKGLALIGNVHFGKSYANAFWTGKYQMMFFGDNGRGQPPFTKADDVVAHEVGHGLTNFMVPPNGITYLEQSGAINEAYSDIVASIVDYRDWKIGEDLGTTFRFMNKPPMGSPPQPADMFDILQMPLVLDNGGVHYNSGIGNFFFYRLATSYAAVAPAPDGRFTAAKVVHRAYTYLAANPNATFAEWGTYLKQAAADLFGVGSGKYKRVVAALDSVHIPQARIVRYDNGWVHDSSGSLLFYIFNTGYPCASVRFTNPVSGAKLKTIAVSLLEQDSSKLTGSQIPPAKPEACKTMDRSKRL